MGDRSNFRKAAKNNDTKSDTISQKPLKKESEGKMFIVAELVLALFVVIGVSMHKGHQGRKKRCTIEVLGKVLDVNAKTTQEYEDTEGGGSRLVYKTMYYPIFQYEANGEVITSESDIGSNSCKFSSGDALPIFYNPEKTSEYYVPADKSSAYMGLVFAGIGGVSMIILLIGHLTGTITYA